MEQAAYEEKEWFVWGEDLSESYGIIVVVVVINHKWMSLVISDMIIILFNTLTLSQIHVKHTWRQLTRNELHQ